MSLFRISSCAFSITPLASKANPPSLTVGIARHSECLSTFRAQRTSGVSLENERSPRARERARAHAWKTVFFSPRSHASSSSGITAGHGGVSPYLPITSDGREWLFLRNHFHFCLLMNARRSFPTRRRLGKVLGQMICFLLYLVSSHTIGHGMSGAYRYAAFSASSY